MSRPLRHFPRPFSGRLRLAPGLWLLPGSGLSLASILIFCVLAPTLAHNPWTGPLFAVRLGVHVPGAAVAGVAAFFCLLVLKSTGSRPGSALLHGWPLVLFLFLLGSVPTMGFLWGWNTPGLNAIAYAGLVSSSVLMARLLRMRPGSRLFRWTLRMAGPVGCLGFLLGSGTGIALSIGSLTGAHAEVDAWLAEVEALEDDLADLDYTAWAEIHRKRTEAQELNTRVAALVEPERAERLLGDELIWSYAEKLERQDEMVAAWDALVIEAGRPWREEQLPDLGGYTGELMLQVSDTSYSRKLADELRPLSGAVETALVSQWDLLESLEPPADLSESGDARAELAAGWQVQRDAAEARLRARDALFHDDWVVLAVDDAPRLLGRSEAKLDRTFSASLDPAGTLGGRELSMADLPALASLSHDAGKALAQGPACRMKPAYEADKCGSSGTCHRLACTAFVRNPEGGADPLVEIWVVWFDELRSRPSTLWMVGVVPAAAGAQQGGAAAWRRAFLADYKDALVHAGAMLEGARSGASETGFAASWDQGGRFHVELVDESLDEAMGPRLSTFDVEITPCGWGWPPRLAGQSTTQRQQQIRAWEARCR